MTDRFPALTLAALVALTLSACAPPQPVSQPAPQVLPPAAPKDRLVAAIEQNGCLLTQDNVAAILLRANLTQDDLLSLAPELAAEGRAEVADSGTIRILSDLCI